MQHSVSHGKTVKSAFLIIIMIIMTQVGYLDLINSPRTGNDSFDDYSSAMETGGSSNSPSTEIRHSYQLDASGLHTCAILDNGTLLCWGLNNRGQVGDGTTTNAHTPVWVDLGTGTTVNEVVNGYRHTCATLSNGSLMCWGENTYGQLGNGQQTQTQTTPVWVDLGVGRTATRIAAAYGTTCAIADNSSLYCWGSNTHGQLGYGNQHLGLQTSPGWVDLGGNAAVAVGVGSMNVCSILNNGSLYCWGSDAYGQLGRGGPFHSSGPQANEYAPLWVDLGAGRTAAQISLGSQHMCAIYDNGSLYCWGHNSYGQLGNGSGGSMQTIGTPSWVDLGAGSTPVAVSAGDFHTCAIVDNGSLYCWGANGYGRLGTGAPTTQPAYSPAWVDLGVGRTALAISAGSDHTCAILDDSSLTCFGHDHNGALGNGPGQSDSSVPGIVDGGFTWDNSTGSNSGSSATDLIASSEGADLTVGQAMTNITFQYDSSAVSGSGSGSGSGSSSSSASAYANNKLDAKHSSHTCAITDNGDLKCWGNDHKGQLGDGGFNTDILAPSSTAIDLGTGRTALQVVTGLQHTCAILDNGDMKCWGYDWKGQLGDGGPAWSSADPTANDLNAPSSTPINLGSGRTAVAASAGDYHTCAILDNGDLKCWGIDSAHGYGATNTDILAPSSTPIDLGMGRTAIAVSAGSSHTCAILDNGDLKCWGADNYGQLGNGGSNIATNAPSSTPIDLGLGRTAIAVSAGNFHTCAILDNGDLKCWGRDYKGQLGDGGTNTDTNAPSSTAIDLGTGRTAVAVSTGLHHTCAILDNGDLKCWGWDNYGQLGDGGTQHTTSTYTTAPSSTAIDLGTGRTAVAVSAGTYYTCAILDNSDAKCWGRQDRGQLGQGSASSVGQITPVLVTGSNTWDSSTVLSSGSSSGSSSSSASAYANNKVGVGELHTCAILDNGDAKCWGFNQQGQLGNGATSLFAQNTPSSTAIDLGTGRTAVAISTGSTHNCAILDNGDMKCWGSDQYGQLGDDMSSANQLSPVSIDFGTGRTAVAISADYYRTCAILDNGDLKCWGRGDYGQLGIGTSNDQYTPPSTPIDLGPGRTAVAVDGGFMHVCAILDNGDLKCWGQNFAGELGIYIPSIGNNNPTKSIPPSTPIDLGSGRTALAVSAGLYHTCAILDNGDLKCWGYDNYGQLGDGGGNTNTYTYIPTAVDLGAGRTAVAVSAAQDYTCAILDNGELKCWGRDIYGRLGDGGTNTDTNAPSTAIDLGTGRTAVAFSAHSGHTCVILDNNEMKCFGRNDYGQLGDGVSNTDQGSPVAVSGSNTWDSSTGASSGSGGMTNVTGATCSVSPSLPTGLSIDGSTCTISGTPSVATTNTTYTVTAVISGTTFQTSVWLSSSNPILTSSVEGVDLETGEVMTDITFNAPLPPANGTIETIFAGGTNARIQDLEADIDSNDVIHAVFFDPDSLSLIYTNDASGTWSSEVLATGESQYDPSIVIDSNDKIHISYLNFTNKEVMYTNNVAGSWATSVASDFLRFWGYNYHCGTSIDVDSNNNAYIAYVYDCGRSTAKLEIADNSGGSWSSTILQQTYSSYHLSDTSFDLILDSDDAAHVLYTMRDGQNNRLNHTTNEGGSWVSTQIGSTVFGSYGIRYVSVNIDSTDVVHSVHQSNSDLIYSNNSGGTWTSTSSSTFPCSVGFQSGTHSCGALSSIFIDTDDNIHISHQFQDARHLLYVNDVSGSWQTAQYNNPGPTGTTGYGYETAVVVDSNGDVEILHGFELNSQMTLVSLYQQGPDSGSGSGSGSGVEYSSPITSATSCVASPSLPTGLNIDSGTCTISGTPTVDSVNTTYTISAVINGITYEADIWLSTFTFGEITSTVDGAELQLGEAMTPISLSYTSQDGHQTAPVNVTGNGSIWWDNQDIFCDCGEHMAIHHGNTIYMDGIVASGSAGHELYAYSIDTGMSWLVADINSNGDSVPGERMSVLIDNTIIFDADDGVHGRELWAHDILTNTTWFVKDINPTAFASMIGAYFTEVMDGVLYFDAKNDTANNVEIWGFNPQNGTAWNVTDIFDNGNGAYPGQYMTQVVGDTLYFGAREDTSWPYPHSEALWAYTATNQTTWLAADINPGIAASGSSSSSRPGDDFSVVIGDTIYFDAITTTGTNLADRKIFAYDTSNYTHWVVTDVDQSDTLSYQNYNRMQYIGVIGSTIYTIGTNYIGMGTGQNHMSQQIWAINTENESAWQVPNFPCLYNSGCGFPTNNMRLIVNDVIYFGFDDDSNAEELWAYNTTNETAWMITDLPGNPFTGFDPGKEMSLVVGDTIYFSGHAHDNSFQQGGSPGYYTANNGHLWAYDISNESLYFVSNHYTDMPTHPTATSSCSSYIINYGVSPGKRFSFVIDDVLYYDIGTRWSETGQGSPNCPYPRVAGYQPSVITYSNYTPPVSWETEPPLPAGMSISGGTISGTPSVYATNQTYTIYANQSGYSTTHELYFSVDNAYPHTVVEDQPIDAIGFHPAFWDGTTTWSISPTLPNTLLQDSATGEITGTVDSPMSDTFTVTATHSSGATETFTFSLESLLDTDGDGLANDLPPTYNPANPPTSGLIADDDDDGDGLLDTVETDTGIYINGQDTGTDPLDPDTDDDGICDGPNAVPPICIAGPDPSPNGNTPPPTLVGVNNTAINDLAPYLVVPGGTFEISPDLPASLSIDPNTGDITGMPTETLTNTTFTVWSNHTDGTSLSWDFTIEILEDSDGDGMPNELPDDYDPTNPDSPGLIEDLDDDNDGNSDVDEAIDGTDPTNPDTDGDGMCDGPVAFEPDCVAGPDAFPLDPSADTDTDGDGDPDTLNPPSNSVPPLVEDLDDDGDGVDDVNETNTGIYNGDTDTGTDPLDPDTDNDGICDGPIDVLPICVAGPDTELGTAIDGTAYLLNNTPMTYLMPKYDVDDAVYEVHPALPAGIVIDPVTGVISGTPTEVTDNITYTLFANVTADGFTSSWSFNMQVLEDTDGDGLPNELPDDYPTIGEAPFDLVEDLDDDGDGASDVAETGTGIFNGSGDMGTDPLDPDTDDDGICDGPNSVLPICIAGPDSNPVGTGPLGPTVLVNNTEMIPLPPANAVPGAIWAVSPDLPAGLTLNVTTGVISGTPLETMDNTTFTLWANTSEPRSVESTFWLEILEDTDGDGMPDQLPDDYPDTGLPPFDLIEDLDDDADGMPDVDEATNGTDSLNPDTDGDGFCDGPDAVDGVCYAGPDSHPLDPALPVNTDGDAFPDDDPDGDGGLIADDDDDNDGFLDTLENDCLSDPIDVNDVPSDMDGDGICDALDDDKDGDGIDNIFETETGIYNSTSDTGTDPANPDTDGDGVCDGPATPDVAICVAGPDAFPNDPAASLDTDGDGMPDELNGNSTTGLIEDLDDDNDTIVDLTEEMCGTDPKVVNLLPDMDGDGICDALDDIIDLDFNMTYESQYVDLFVNKTMVDFLPNVTGIGEVASWEIDGEIPEGLTFGWSPARDAMLDGGIRGTPTNYSEEPVNVTVWANNSNYQHSFILSITVFNDTDNDSLPDSLPANYTGNITVDHDDDNDGFFDQDEIDCGSNPYDNSSSPENTDGDICDQLQGDGDNEDDEGMAWWCFPLCFLLLLLLLIPIFLLRDRVIALVDDAEPENTTSKPKFTDGVGTKDNPFILKPLKTVKPGSVVVSKELITITDITPGLKVKSQDYFDRENERRFLMQDDSGSEEGTRMIVADDDGVMKFRLLFDDSFKPTLAGGEFQGAVKVGRRSVYFMWDIKVKPDPDYVKEQKKLEAERKKAEKEAEKQSKKEAAEAEKQAAKEAKEAEKKAEKEAEETAAAEAEEKARLEEEEAEAAKKAEEEALAAVAIAEAEEKAQKKAEKDAKAAEAKAKKEAAADKKAKKEAEEAEKKAKEEADAKATKEAEAKAKKEADAAAAAEAEAKAKKEAEEAEKKAKADAEKAKKAAAKKKPATTKEAKKEEEIERVKSRAKTIDFKVLGTASSTKLKSEVKKGAKTLEVANAKEFADAGSAAITDDKGSTIITWTGKDGNTLTGVGGITRVFGKASVVMVKDDLQVIKGIGPFIEEKLNALGITTYRQIANMTAKLETQVNEAIEFFPGRVKRDQWVNQAKILLGEDVKLDEKALKQAEELERIAKKAETIDFATLGVATIDEKDDLQTIKGIGPFIAEKLYALGIYTFEQVGNMTSKIEEEVNKAIEFFPGRVKRDQWAKQARELHDDKK